MFSMLDDLAYYNNIIVRNLIRPCVFKYYLFCPFNIKKKVLCGAINESFLNTIVFRNFFLILNSACFTKDSPQQMADDISDSFFGMGFVSFLFGL